MHSTLTADITSGLRIEARQQPVDAAIRQLLDDLDLDRRRRLVPLDVSFTEARSSIEVVGDTIFIFDWAGDGGERVWVRHVEPG